MFETATLPVITAGTFEERTHIMHGRNLNLLPSELVGSWTTGNVEHSALGGSNIVTIEVVDSQTAIAHMPAGTYGSRHTIRYFGTPNDAPRTLLDIPLY